MVKKTKEDDEKEVVVSMGQNLDTENDLTMLSSYKYVLSQRERISNEKSY